MAFEHPFFAIAGILALITLPFLSRLMKDALAIDVPLGPPGGTPFKPPYSFSLFMKALRVTECIGILSLFIAAAGPLFLSSQTVWLSRGADIIFVLDISPSMACLDMNNKSRFDASKALVRGFAERRPSDNIGLVAVGKDASLLTPPTVDREALFSRLDALRLGELGDGTALGVGLAIAGLHISGSNAAKKAVALITDGENNAGSINPATAAGIFPELGVNFWVIAVGSSGEIPIDYIDPFTKLRRTGFFESRFDPEKLKQIASRGNGTYAGAPSADTFAEAFALFDQRELSIQRSGSVTKTKPVHSVFAIAAVLLIAAARFIRRYIAGIFL
ncbi:MAG: VWA domain-containing protein [Treponema sp.]|jgi:Ca-activated chloride channel family protein|nr:VWA domain-containing protein [Treponema sp.]